ncbi:MAG: hypothetical protein IJ706_08970, partial [Clostridia bacterium]|nr:hypothetical protein [Clostridia bacterium]
VVDLMKEVEKDGENWFDGEEKLPLIAAVFMNVSVENVFDYVEAFKGDVKDAVKTVVSGIFGEHKVDDFFEDIKNESVNEFLDKDFFENSVNEIVIAEYVADILAANGGEELAEAILGAFDGVRLGDIVNLTDLVRYEDKWINKDGKATILVLADTLDITVGQIRDYIKNEDKLDAMGIVKKVVADNYTAAVLDYVKATDKITEFVDKKSIFDSLGEVTLTDILEGVTGDKAAEYIFKDLLGKIMIGDVVDLMKEVEKDGENWFDGEEKLPLIASVFMNVSVENVFDYVEAFKGDKKEAVNKVVSGIFKGHTVGEFLDDIKNESARKYLDKEFFTKSVDNILIATYVADIMNAEGDGVIDVIRTPFNTVSVGNIVDFIKSVYSDGENWYFKANDKKLPLIAKTFMDIEVQDVFGYIDEFKNDDIETKKAVYDMVLDIFGDHSVYDYVNDIVAIKNEGLERLATVYIAETVGVMLGVLENKDELMLEVVELPFVGTLEDLRLDYALSWLDIHIGEFVLGEDRPNGDWSENGFLNFVYNVKVNEVVMIIGAIFMYEKVLEMIGDERLGYFFMDLYNDKLGEALGGETVKSGDDYVVSGKFAEVIERVMNIVINDIYYSIIGRDGHNMMKLVEDTFYSLKLGDIFYDLTEMGLNKALDLQMNVSAKENVEANGGEYVLTGNYAEILERTFAVTVRQIVEAAKDGEFKALMKETYGDTYLGDYVADIIKTYLAKALGINMEGYAYEYVNREEEGNEPREREARRVRGKNAYGYDLPDGKYAVMLETIFNVRIDKFTEAVENNEIAKWAEETFFELTVRDMFFDIVKEAVGENENYVFEGYASEDKEVTGKAHKIINATLGVSIS